MSSYNLIGLMSGTSMDGLDIVEVEFQKAENNDWGFSVKNSLTVKYTESILFKLNSSKQLTAIELLLLDKELGRFFSSSVNHFIQSFKIDKNTIDAIASHGHTIFHQPEKGFTHQIGCGDTLAFNTGINVINDFRQKDVVAGGQGAPLVPIGDKLLFYNEANAFLNIGGFANICIPGNSTKAFDICPGNLPLNYLAQKMMKEYDKDGEMAKQGKLNTSLLDQLDKLDYYKKEGPKSLGTEWLENSFLPLIQSEDNIFDTLNSVTEHIAMKIAEQLITSKCESVYITGGGTRNSYLIERIKTHYKGVINIPSDTIIDFKEAIIFAFLGALFLNDEPNCLSSVTGASRDTTGGVFHKAN